MNENVAYWRFGLKTTVEEHFLVTMARSFHSQHYFELQRIFLNAPPAADTCNQEGETGSKDSYWISERPSEHPQAA